MEVDWKGSDKENYFAMDSVVLVDIPVVHRQERLSLESLINMDNHHGSIVKEHGGRKWKRMAYKRDEQ